jgi:hypothetical protein
VCLIGLTVLAKKFVGQLWSRIVDELNEKRPKHFGKPFSSNELFVNDVVSSSFAVEYSAEVWCR